ncbi:arylsulfatase [Dactylosporangium roseum]|uniref:Arylsulfatase n=1 Tax=Dactylosporangium roseum TaxID=47989 RepID=A0ABY5YYY1_9ACTN|nr:arylsulfatase [Dactylosporangium roseum]UWZ34727.1 arylsulfatase [Dactylosporangium roseum]
MNTSGFPGRIGRTVDDATPWWPPSRTGRGRPNVVLIVLDDVGFAQLGCYGSAIRTPRMDALAAGGVRYTNFHVAALCSPTRASLLTGRNHHSVGMGFLAAFDTGFPGYRAEVTPRAATVAEVLRDTGYGTYAAGKWHLAPPTQLTAAGPFDQWPTRRGFDRYYGFLWGEDDQFEPELWSDQHRVDVPDDPDYHLSEDLVRTACGFVADHVTGRPDDPFFLYLAFGACHAPHQAPPSFLDRYRGAFDHGWDAEREAVLARQVELGVVPPQTELPPRNPDVRAWGELPGDERRLYTRMQEVFAGFMEHTDEQIGVLVDFLDRHGLLDDTLLLVVSDNGASGEGGRHGTANEYRYFLGLGDSIEDGLAAIDDLGGPAAHNHYPSGWAQAGNTPLRYYKKHTYSGGVRVPLIAHWPRGIDPAVPLRGQFHHAVDILPTITALAGVEMPESYRGHEQIPVHGTSMAYTFTDPAAASTRTTQYFETAGFRGIYRDGWKAVADHTPGTAYDDDRWELFDLTTDVSEAHDLAAHHPGLLRELIDEWDRQAGQYGVLPLDDRMGTRIAGMDPAADRLHYRMLPGTRIMNSVAGPTFAGRSFHINAVLTGPPADGVLLAYGRRAHGFTFYVRDGRPVFALNLAGDRTVVRPADPLPAEARRIGLLVQDGPGGVHAELTADGTALIRGALPRLLPGGMGTLSLQCGHNAPSAVTDDYTGPFRYTGELLHVEIDLQPRSLDTRNADWLAEVATQ